MPSPSAATSAFVSSRDAIAVTSQNCPSRIAGITFRTAMSATPRTPHRTFVVICTPPHVVARHPTKILVNHPARRRVSAPEISSWS
jgi:hypothetical protein